MVIEIARMDIERTHPVRTNLIETMQMAWRAWDEDPEETIKDCFKKQVFGIKPLMIQKST